VRAGADTRIHAHVHTHTHTILHTRSSHTNTPANIQNRTSARDRTNMYSLTHTRGEKKHARVREIMCMCVYVCVRMKKRRKQEER